MEISTDGTFYAGCITWLCHPKQAVEVYGMCMVRCPACKGGQAFGFAFLRCLLRFCKKAFLQKHLFAVIIAE